MGKKPTNWRLWGKVAAVSVVVAVGGPAFTAWLSPSEEEIRAKYNPDLRRRSIEGKAQREQEFDEFVTRLKEYSKSDKPSTPLPTTVWRYFGANDTQSGLL